MASSIFDLQDNLSAPSESWYDKFLQQRQMLAQQRPDVASQLPTLGAATPGERMYQTAQQQPAQDLASTVQQVTAPLAQAVAGPQAKPKQMQEAAAGVDEVLAPMNPLNPKQTYGPNIGKALGMGENAGGILGTGVQPIDVLAFALGAAVTSNLPQDKAMAMTFKIAGLPGEFRKNQEAQALKFIQAKQEEINSQLTGGNLAMRQVENAYKIKALQDKQGFLNDLTKRLSTGVPLSSLERQVFAVRGSKVLDGETLKQVLLRNDPAEQLATIQEISKAAQNAGMGSVSSELMLEGGGKVKIGGGSTSGRALTAGELSDALATGKNSDKLLAAGFDVTTPQGRSVVERAYNERKTLERERVNISMANSERAQKIAEGPRPEESKKLEALIELHRGGSDMLQKYEASLASHGGKWDGALQTAIQGATTSPDGIIGKSIQALSQRYPGLTQQDYDFISRYATMQKFARGSLNDVGNLSNYERGIFNTMTGTPLDKPELFRSRITTALGDAQAAYVQARRGIPSIRDLSGFPEALGAPRGSGGGSQATPTHRYNPATGKVEEIKR